MAPVPARSELMILRVLLAIVLPPAAVLMREGISQHFWINLGVTVFGYFPGLFHALTVFAPW
jgi:uncharacterized membrane protein YqaE (UPF0057 family)